MHPRVRHSINNNGATSNGTRSPLAAAGSDLRADPSTPHEAPQWASIGECVGSEQAYFSADCKTLCSLECTDAAAAGNSGIISNVVSTPSTYYVRCAQPGRPSAHCQLWLRFAIAVSTMGAARPRPRCGSSPTEVVPSRRSGRSQATASSNLLVAGRRVVHEHHVRVDVRPGDGSPGLLQASGQHWEKVLGG